MNTIGFLTIEPWYLMEEISLMQELIYFDKLCYSSEKIENTEIICGSMPYGSGLFAKKMEEIEKYKKVGLITEYSGDDFENDAALFHGSREARELGKKVIEYRPDEDKHDNSSDDLVHTLYTSLNNFREIRELKSRVYSVIMNKRTSDYYTPIVREKYNPLVRFDGVTPCDTLSIVMKKFPKIDTILDENKFFEFKQDPDTKLKLSRLNNWISEISSSNLSAKEIEQKLEYLLLEYSNQLKIHEIKFSQGVLETIVSTSLEILENIVTLKFSTASKVLFDLSKKKLDLLEAENNAVGKEVAFIHYVNKAKSSTLQTI